MITSNEQMRLAKMEAMCDHLRSEMSDVLERAYAIAVEERDEDRAAELARKIRNKLLDDSDKYNTVDRVFNFDLPETISTTNVISAVKALIEGINGITANDWSVYRQHLRDITDQPGFPFDIDWGTAPDAEEATKE